MKNWGARQAGSLRYVPQASCLLLSASICLSTSAQIADTRQAWQKLDAEPDILVNAQGLAQQDLSVRGGSYTGTGLSINGLRLRTAWSAHNNTDFPMLGNLLAAPTVGTGLQNVSGHLVGTMNFNTQPLNKATTFSAGLGTKERFAATIYGTSENVGGYVDWEKANEIDYSANDLERFTGSAFLQYLSNDWMIDLVLANQSKDFGAQGYYGAPSTVVAEQSIDDSMLMASATRGELDDAYFRTTAIYRDLRDQYMVPSSAYFSDITSRNAGLVAEGRTMEVQHIALNLRGDLEYERVSGDAPENDRFRSSYLILPEARFERFTLKAGLNTVFQSSESAEFLPMAGIDWFVSDNGKVYLSYTETEQQPDYQTLYSTAPYQTGNPLLKQQHTQNSELGFKHFLSASCDWHIGTFFRTLENANDWVGGTATDLGELNVAGIDGSISFYPTENLELKAFYQWLHKDNDIENGLYETDYPEHMLNFSAYWRFLSDFTAQFSQTTRWQADNAVRTSDDFGALASLGLHYDMRFAKNVRLSFLVDNLWGSKFQSIPGLKPRPTTVFAGIVVGW